MIEDHLEYLKKWNKTTDYCIINDQIKTSVYNFANYAKDCLPSKDIKRANVLNAITKIISDFFCFKDGDRFLSKFSRAFSLIIHYVVLYSVFR